MTEDYEQEWDNLDEKEILMGILTELQQIRLLLQAENLDQEDSSKQLFECTKCGKTYSKDERREHAMSTHKAPEDMVDSLFTEID